VKVVCAFLSFSFFFLRREWVEAGSSLLGNSLDYPNELAAEKGGELAPAALKRFVDCCDVDWARLPKVIPEF